MKILVIVNWKINYFNKDVDSMQPPDKVVKGKKYWFFKYWSSNKDNIDVLDFCYIPFFHYIEKNKLKFYIFQAIRGLWRSRNYDLVISHGAQSAMFMSFIRSILGITSPPHFLIDVGCFNGGRNNKVEISLIRFAARSLSGIIYHSTIQREYYEKFLPFLLERSKFIPFGVDTDSFYPLNVDEENYIVSIGYAKRDYYTLLKAWNSINFEKTRLKIVGISSFKNLGFESENFSRVDLLGIVSINKLKEIISKSKFVVTPLPVYKYSYGQMSLLQSMSMGKAVIVTKTPSTIDYVTNGENGVFVEPYNVDDMKQKIVNLLKEPKLCSKLGRKARISIEENYNERIMSENIYNFIRKLVW